jgi:hypothetical protein
VLSLKQKIKNCKLCDKEFVVRSNRQLYCSRSCKDKAYWRRKNPLEVKSCEYCGKSYIPKHNNSQCCSEDCSEELHRIKSKKCMYKLRKDNPDIVHSEWGSKGTSTTYNVIKDENGQYDFDKEAEWAKKERKRLRV